jgi:hypothetical protein
LLETGKATLERAFGTNMPLESFSIQEVASLEAIVVAVGRPAILIRENHFDSPPELWQILENYRPNIERVVASVGRIEVTGHSSLDWVGTGFLIAPGVIATNRHVVQEFALPNWQGRWNFDSGVQVRIDFAEEIDSQQPREFPITRLIGVHDRLDIGLLRVDDMYRNALPNPLPLDGGGVPLGRDQNSYVVGYPALDSRRNDSATMQRIFGDIYNVKRLQPGLLRDWSPQLGAYLHDCSTLGGNSGSCLIDLATSCVVGIHFGGRFGENNWALSTRDLVGDVTLRGLGAQFVN